MPHCENCGDYDANTPDIACFCAECGALMCRCDESLVRGWYGLDRSLCENCIVGMDEDG